MEFINSLLNSAWGPYIYGALFYWFIVGISNRDKRKTFFSGLSSLFSQPSVFEKAKTNPGNQPVKQSGGLLAFYPRSLLETIAHSFKEALIEPLQKGVANLKLAIKDKKDALEGNNPGPWKMFGYALQFFLLAAFIWADAIAIANTLQFFGYIAVVPSYLSSFELSIGFGSLLAIIVGGLVASDLFGEGEFTDWAVQKESGWKTFVKWMVFFLILSGSAVVVLLSIGRLGGRVTFTQEALDRINLWAEIGTLVLVPLNATISALLIHREGFKGLYVIYLAIASIFLFVLQVFLYLANILGSMGIFGLDLVYRFLLMIINVIGYYLTAPLDLWATSSKNPGSSNP